MTTTTELTAAPELAGAPLTSPAGHLGTTLRHTWYLSGRRLHAVLRQPAFIAVGLIQPVIWLFLFGELFRKIVDIPGFAAGGSYLAYLIPGIVAMSAMNGNMWAGMNAMEEIDRGTLNRFLVSPARRVALMNANVVERAVTTTVQTVIILVLGPAGRVIRAASLGRPSWSSRRSSSARSSAPCPTPSVCWSASARRSLGSTCSSCCR
jgi:hypothetical protein